MKLVKVKDDNSLARDLNSQGIVNTNLNHYQQHMAIKKARKQKDASVENEINNLKDELTEIKKLLKELLGK